MACAFLASSYNCATSSHSAVHALSTCKNYASSTWPFTFKKVRINKLMMAIIAYLIALPN